MGQIESLGAGILDHPGREFIPAGLGIFRILLRELLWRIDRPLFFGQGLGLKQ
jgi:hypothetical protein